VSTPWTAAAPPSSSHLYLISWAPSLDPLATSCSGAVGRGAGRFGRIGVLQEDEGGARLCLGGFWRLLANCRLEAQSLLKVTTGLNNQRLGAVLLF
jgi:hypothetical protein